MTAHTKLGSVNVVIHILPLQFQQLALINVIEVSHTGHFSVFIFQTEHRISILTVSIHNMVYISGYRLHVSSLRKTGHFAGDLLIPIFINSLFYHS